MIQITEADFQQMIYLMLSSIIPAAMLIGFLFAFMWHDCIIYWFEIAIRWLRRRAFRNKVRR